MAVSSGKESCWSVSTEEREDGTGLVFFQLMKPSDSVNYTCDVPLKQLGDAVGWMLRVQMEKFGNGKRRSPIWAAEMILLKWGKCWWVGGSLAKFTWRQRLTLDRQLFFRLGDLYMCAWLVNNRGTIWFIIAFVKCIQFKLWLFSNVYILKVCELLNCWPVDRF